MLRKSVALSARGYGVLRYAPTNLLFNAIRARRRPQMGHSRMLLAVSYLYATAICTTIINGGAGWLNADPAVRLECPHVPLDRTCRPSPPGTGEILGAPLSVARC